MSIIGVDLAPLKRLLRKQQSPPAKVNQPGAATGVASALTGRRMAVRTTAVPTALTAADHVLVVTSFPPVVITLPAVLGSSGREFVVRVNGAGAVTLAAAPGELINGAAAIVLAAAPAAGWVVCDGTQWLSLSLG